MAGVTAERLGARHLDGLLEQYIPSADPDLAEEKLRRMVARAERRHENLFHYVLVRTKEGQTTYLGFFSLLKNGVGELKLNTRFGLGVSNDHIEQCIARAIECARQLYPDHAVIAFCRTGSFLIPLFEHSGFQVHHDAGMLLSFCMVHVNTRFYLNRHRFAKFIVCNPLQELVHACVSSTRITLNPTPAYQTRRQTQTVQFLPGGCGSVPLQ